MLVSAERRHIGGRSSGDSALNIQLSCPVHYRISIGFGHRGESSQDDCAGVEVPIGERPLPLHPRKTAFAAFAACSVVQLTGFLAVQSD